MRHPGALLDEHRRRHPPRARGLHEPVAHVELHVLAPALRRRLLSGPSRAQSSGRCEARYWQDGSAAPQFAVLPSDALFGGRGRRAKYVPTPPPTSTAPTMLQRIGLAHTDLWCSPGVIGTTRGTGASRVTLFGAPALPNSNTTSSRVSRAST